jgi:hypothetical protein
MSAVQVKGSSDGSQRHASLSAETSNLLAMKITSMLMVPKNMGLRTGRQRLRWGDSCAIDTLRTNLYNP